MRAVKLLASRRKSHSFIVSSILLVIIAIMTAPVASIDIGYWTGDPEYEVTNNNVNFIGNTIGCDVADGEIRSYLQTPQTGFDIPMPVVKITPSAIYTGIHVEVEAYYLPQTSRYLIDFQMEPDISPSISNLDRLLNYGGSCSNRLSVPVPEGEPYADGVPPASWWEPVLNNALPLDEPEYEPHGNIEIRSPWKIKSSGCAKVIYEADFTLNTLGACYHDFDHTSAVDIASDEDNGDIIVRFSLAASIVTLTNQTHEAMPYPYTYKNINRVSWIYPVTATFGATINTVSLGNTGQGSTFIRNIDLTEVGGSLNIKMMVGYTPPTNAFGGMTKSFDDAGWNGITKMTSTNPDVTYMVMDFQLLDGFYPSKRDSSLLLSAWSTSTRPPGGVFDGIQSVVIGTVVCDSDNLDLETDRELLYDNCVVANVMLSFKLTYTAPIESVFDVDLKTSFNLYLGSFTEPQMDLSPTALIGTDQSEIVLSAGSKLCFKQTVEGVLVDENIEEPPRNLGLSFDVVFVYICRPDKDETEVIYDPENGKTGCIGAQNSLEFYPKPGPETVDIFAPFIHSKDWYVENMELDEASAAVIASGCFVVDPANDLLTYSVTQPRNGRFWMHVVSRYKSPYLEPPSGGAKRDVHHIYKPTSNLPSSTVSHSAKKPVNTHTSPSKPVGPNGKHTTGSSTSPYPPPSSTHITPYRNETKSHNKPTPKTLKGNNNNNNNNNNKVHNSPHKNNQQQQYPSQNSIKPSGRKNQVKSTTIDYSSMNKRVDGMRSITVTAAGATTGSVSPPSTGSSVVIEVDYKDVKWGEWWIVLIFVLFILVSICICWGLVFCFSDEKERKRIKEKREQYEALKQEEEDSLSKEI